MPLFTKNTLIAALLAIPVFGTAVIGANYSSIITHHLVDITNGAYNKYYLYRKLNAAGQEQWLIQDERSGMRPLDREQFEAILQALLS